MNGVLSVHSMFLNLNPHRRAAKAAASAAQLARPPSYPQPSSHSTDPSSTSESLSSDVSSELLLDSLLNDNSPIDTYYDRGLNVSAMERRDGQLATSLQREEMNIAGIPQGSFQPQVPPPASWREEAPANADSVNGFGESLNPMIPGVPTLRDQLENALANTPSPHQTEPIIGADPAPRPVHPTATSTVDSSRNGCNPGASLFPTPQQAGEETKQSDPGRIALVHAEVEGKVKNALKLARLTNEHFKKYELQPQLHKLQTMLRSSLLSWLTC